PELLRIGWASDSTREERTASQANFNYRMVEVVMMLLLPLLAVSLAIPPKRSTSSLGVFVSIVMVVAYHKVNEYGQSVASLGRIDPTLALWGPFVVFAAIILWMYYRVAFIPGAQAIGALETAFAKLVKWLKQITRRRRRSHQMGMVADAA
ncbi:MAG TPA: LptF/LptG family permease, partial [Rhodanobacteraceae bacterium]|nr:LptF/LptG family permease [Rhodanobacteraceae bacterium]